MIPDDPGPAWTKLLDIHMLALLYIPVTISDVEQAVPDSAARASLFEGNSRKVLGI